MYYSLDEDIELWYEYQTFEIQKPGNIGNPEYLVSSIWIWTQGLVYG